MNFSARAIHRPLPAVLLFVVLCILGLHAFKQLPIARLPDVSLPMVTVMVNLPGSPPAQLETDVTRRVENAVAMLEGVKRTFSIVSEGQSVTVVEFHLEKERDPILDDVRDAVTRIRVDLPPAILEPVISKLTLTGGTLLAYTIRAPGWRPDELSWFVDDTVTRALFSVRGIAQVTRTGGIEREVRIDLKPTALIGFGITAGEVSQQLARIQAEHPAGQVEWGGERQVIRAVGTLDDPQDLRDFPIALPDGRSVRLSALADVSDAAADPTALALLDGEPVVGFSMVRARGSSEVAVGKAVRQVVADLAAQHPGMEFVPVFSTVEEAERSYKASMMMLWEGGALAVLVVLLFLRNWQATWISALALPLSIIPTFAIMYWFGFSLNIFTLLALAVVVGILVDDAIVEAENIMRHLRMGKSPKQAALDAAQEIGLAVIATSMALAAVFVPVAFMPGIVGKFFQEFGWTAASAVLFSLLVARLLTPMLAAYKLKPKPEPDSDGKLMRWYLGWVDAALRHRARTLWIAFAIFIGSLALLPLVPATLFPTNDMQRSNLNLELPPGTPIETTTAVAEQARARLADIPELKQVYSMVGSALDLGDVGDNSVGGETRKATLILDWGEPALRARHQKALERETRTRLLDLAGVRVSFTSTESGALLELMLSSDDPVRLADAVQAIERELHTIPGLGSITSSASLLRPELVIVPDPVRAAERGVTTEAIAEAARIATAGDYTQHLAKFNLPERQIPIRVGFPHEALSEPALIGQLRVAGRDGPVPLSSVADIRQDSGQVVINRFQRQRNIMLTAELNGRALGDVMAEVERLPSVRQLPPGVNFLNSGDAEAFIELFVGFLLAMVTGLACIYAVLLLLFNNAFQPVTILSAVPLCTAGAFGALLATQTPLSLPALIGLLMLIGVATKNSILLVDYAITAQRQGISRRDALIDACYKRARPVIMTSLAMSAGMAPLALGFSADSSFRAPMAVAVIGGLATSTVLSLIVVPAAYTLIDDGCIRLARWRRRKNH